MSMEMLAQLSRMDNDGDDEDLGRPTPLDPEYWSGITHSLEPTRNVYAMPATGGYDMYPVAQPQVYGGGMHPARYGHTGLPDYGGGGGVYQHPAMLQRPATASSAGNGYAAGGGSTRLMTSPINYDSSRGLPLSPVASSDLYYAGRVEMRHPMTASMDWGVAQPARYASPPHALKAELRDAFVRAHAFADLLSLFRSYDSAMAGMIPVHAVQDALAMIGVVVPSHVAQGILQQCGLPGSDMVDYAALIRFLELDGKEWDQLRHAVSGNRRISGFDIASMLSQHDATRSGFVPWSLFGASLRECGILLSEGAMHFLHMQLAKPFDSMSVSYTRFLDLVGANGPAGSWGSPTHIHQHVPQSSWDDTRYPQRPICPGARPYEPPFATPTWQGRRSFIDHAGAQAVEVTLPRHGWICRVCAHQQVEDWVTQCEVCETSKPKTGKYSGFLKCKHCKFDNNYDLDDCEMCGRPLSAGARKSRSEKKGKRNRGRSQSSSSRSSSSSSSDSSARSRRSSRSNGRKSERHVRSSSRRRKSPRRPRFQKGEEISAVPLGEKDFEIGVVSKVRSDGTYDIEFDNGQFEKNVDEGSLREISRARVVRAEDVRAERRPSPPASEDDKGPRFSAGDRIDAQFQGRDRYFPGTIQRARPDGTYDILYDDSEVEMKVKSKFIRASKPKSPKRAPQVEETTRKPAPSTTDTSGSEAGYSKGQKVEVKLKGSARFVKGAIFRAHPDGTYDVEFDTGELEKHVPSNCIRVRASSPVKKPAFQSDDEPIRAKRPVSSTPKKPAVSDSSSDAPLKPARKYREGQKVEAQFKGGERFYPGVISRCRLNGTYDIEYDDGEKETGVKAELVRARESSSPGKKPTATDPSESDRKPPAKFTIGQNVEAKYKGRDKWYPGVIVKVRLGGKYDINYEDGEQETCVPAALIKAKSSTPTNTKPANESEDDRRPKKFRDGDKIEAQYKGKSKWYPGVISRCRLNGTYDIAYDDGESETGVAAELIRAKGGSSSPAKKKPADESEDDRRPKKFRDGDKIEAQYKGKSKWYPGVISRCRLNGTYDIAYDDGESETGVAAELIRAKGGSSSPAKKKPADESEDDRRPKKFRDGDKIEAQYKGKSKWYPGVISRCRLNGTYDIAYDDGESETGVAAELIRAKGGSSSPAKKKPADESEDDRRPKKFRDGDKIEAQYKGKSKWYPGVISRCRLNGTYDIAYDDGESETGVAAELIRAKGGSSSPAKKKPADESEDDRRPKKFRDGDKIEAQYKGKSKWYPGVISRCRLNGTYDIAYDDGESETGVAAELIRAKGGSSSPAKKKPADESEDDRRPKKFRDGDKIEAQYKGKSKWYPGVISRCRLNGTYDIAYDDGESETGVAAELIRAKGGSSSPAKKKPADESEDDRRPKKFRDGDKIEAQYKGKSKWYPGVISRCRLNGTYDIAYDDGESETGVAAELIRAKGGSSSPAKKKPADESEDDRRPKKFRDGDKIEAQYKGKSKWYPGVISRCRLNGTYDIAYDDGESETGVAAELIRAKGGSSSPAKKKPADESEDDRRPKKFRDGDKIEAQYKGKSKWYPGVISRCRLNGTYDIAYDDGESETGVAAELIRAKGGSSSPAKKKPADESEDDRRPKKFRDGDKIEAQYKGKSKWYPGVISRCRLNGTYDIAYDDGESETGVAAELIRAKGGSSSPAKKKPADESEDDRRPKKFRDGDKIEAQYKGKSKWYPGVISRCRLNGTYDIAYDDGESETGVAAELIRAKGGSSSPAKKKPADESEDDRRPKKFRDGDKIEAQYKGKSKWYPGVISRCRLNGTYDIAYDDGESETGVAAELIRAKGGSSSPAKKKPADESEDDRRPKKFRDGDKIEAQYKGKSKWYPGVISRCRLNGTYDIAYDDGESETGVAAELIRAKGGSSSPAKKKPADESEDDRRPKKFRDGDKIEAQYKGKSKWYPGVISRCRLNGTYDIAYDDGESETGVAAELIRAKGGSSSPAKKKPADESEDDRRPKKFRDGDKIEAQYKGKSKWYPGVISRCRLNGTYDIAYDDGESETGVAAELIRAKGGSSSPAKKKPADESEDDRRPKKFRDGDKIEAQYKGKSKWYPGVISRCRLNGTYDIAYDDGESETGVAAELIRAKGGSSSPAKKKPADESEDDRRPKKFRDGDKIEAQYKGKSKWYPGVISRCRLNGTYDIAYDDGESETGVAAELIRAKGGSGIAAKATSGRFSDDSDVGARGSMKQDASTSFRPGSRVEALYQGKTKYFKGTISRANADGSYDVEYDDGDKETKVPARNIRLVNTSNFSATAEFSSARPSRPATSGKRRSGNSSD